MTESSPVHVLHLIDGLGGGGTERWVWDIVRLSAPESTKHCVITIYLDPGNYIYAERLRAKGAYHQPTGLRTFGHLGKIIQDLATVRPLFVPFRRFLTLIWRLGCYGLTAWLVLKALLHFRPHVIHTHGFRGLRPGLLIKVLFSKPLVHTVPALFSQMRDMGDGWMPRLYARRHSRIDCFFTGASTADLLAAGVPASKVIDIRSGGVDLQDVDVVGAERDRHYAEVRRSLGLSEDARIALSVGRLHPSKGHMYALEALPALLDRFSNLHWVVLGEGIERAALEARARDLGVVDHAHLIGFRPDPLPYYAAADVYLRTPVFEAENTSSYQAMAMGLPVVGFDTGAETELIGKAGHGILVPNKDRAALAKAVASILMLPDGGRTMGELGARYCREHLDIRHTISLFSSVYADLSRNRT